MSRERGEVQPEFPVRILSYRPYTDSKRHIKAYALIHHEGSILPSNLDQWTTFGDLLTRASLEIPKPNGSFVRVGNIEPEFTEKKKRRYYRVKKDAERHFLGETDCISIVWGTRDDVRRVINAALEMANGLLRNPTAPVIVPRRRVHR